MITGKFIKSKTFIVFLYIISVILLYIGITMPAYPQITLDAILLNANKLLIVILSALFSDIAEKLARPSFINIKNLSSKKDNDKIPPAILFIMGIVLASVVGFILYIFSNPIPSTIAIIYLIEFFAALIVILEGTVIIYDLNFL
jgi:F0F1-type ATP synthase assembly protein I